MSFVTPLPSIKNYFSNPKLENGLTTEWSLGTIGTLTNGLPTATPTFGSGAAGTLALSAVSSGQLSGKYSLSLASSAATTAGNMMASSVLNLDIEDQAKVLTFSCSYKLVTGIAGTNCNFSGTSANSLAYAVWDVTNSVWLTSQGNFNFVQATGVGQCVGTFQTGASTAQVRICVYFPTATSAAFATYFDSFACSPQTIQKGSQISDWIAYTPTVSAGFGTATNIAFFYRRDGDMMSVQGTFTVGTTAASLATLTLPSGLSLDSSKISINNTSSNPGTMVGYYDNSEALANTQGNIVTAPATSTTLVYFGTGQTTGTSSLTPANGNVVTASSVVMSVNFSVPIAGWSSNSVMSSDTDTRIIDLQVNDASSITPTGTISTTFAGSGTINFNKTPVKDSAGAYSSGVYTVPVAGDYDCSAFSEISCTGNTGSFVAIGFAVNGVQKSVNAVKQATNPNLYPYGQTLLTNLKAGDLITVRLWTDVTSPAFAASSVHNLSIKRVSGPAVVTATESVGCKYTSSTTTVGTTGTTVTMPTKVQDTHNAYSTSTGLYTVPVSGAYAINFKVQTAGETVATNTWALYLSITKNGTITDSTYVVGSGGATINYIGSIYAENTFLAGETIGFKASVGTAGALTGTAPENCITVRRIGN